MKKNLSSSRPHRIARIDAGPAAITFTPRRDVAGDSEAAGLTRKGDRLLLAERIGDAGARLDRVLIVIEELAA